MKQIHPKTMARIFKGLEKYNLDIPRPQDIQVMRQGFPCESHTRSKPGSKTIRRIILWSNSLPKS